MNGYEVVAVDQSEVGLAKARRLAQAYGVRIETVVSDVVDYVVEPGQWSAVVLIFAHLLPHLRERVHRAATLGLRAGGMLILEAYTPAQLAFGTGGPRSGELLMNLNQLSEDFAGLEFLVARELEREVCEGIGHCGRGAVVQIAARKRM